MKTPYEIKKGLECCSKLYLTCAGNCSYKEPHGPTLKCMIALKADALAYIYELEAKLAEYEKPLVPMALEEVIEKSKCVQDNVIWLEQPDEQYGYDDTECIPALVSNFSSIGANGIQYVKFLVWPRHEVSFPVIEGTEYGETWRCWSCKPTYEERKAAKWDA